MSIVEELRAAGMLDTTDANFTVIDPANNDSWGKVPVSLTGSTVQSAVDALHEQGSLAVKRSFSIKVQNSDGKRIAVVKGGGETAPAAALAVVYGKRFGLTPTVRADEKAEEEKAKAEAKAKAKAEKEKAKAEKAKAEAEKAAARGAQPVQNGQPVQN